jgi:hypothetical protein
MRRGYIAAVFISRPYYGSYIPQLQMRLRKPNGTGSHSGRSGGIRAQAFVD